MILVDPCLGLNSILSLSELMNRVAPHEDVSAASGLEHFLREGLMRMKWFLALVDVGIGFAIAIGALQHQS